MKNAQNLHVIRRSLICTVDVLGNDITEADVAERTTTVTTAANKGASTRPNLKREYGNLRSEMIRIKAKCMTSKLE